MTIICLVDDDNFEEWIEMRCPCMREKEANDERDESDPTVGIS